MQALSRRFSLCTLMLGCKQCKRKHSSFSVSIKQFLYQFKHSHSSLGTCIWLCFSQRPVSSLEGATPHLTGANAFLSYQVMGISRYGSDTNSVFINLYVLKVLLVSLSNVACHLRLQSLKSVSLRSCPISENSTKSFISLSL